MKKIISIALTTTSIILILISMSSISSRGLIQGYTTFYQTILTHNIVDKLRNGINVSNLFLNTLFFIGIMLLIVSDLYQYKEQKVKSTFLIILNMIGFVGILFTFLNCQYMIMFMIVVIMVTVQTIMQTIDKTDKSFSAIVAVLSGCIGIINIYFLINHLSIAIFYSQKGSDITDYVINKLIGISRINLLCFALMCIPCVSCIIKHIISNKATKE